MDLLILTYKKASVDLRIQSTTECKILENPPNHPKVYSIILAHVPQPILPTLVDVGAIKHRLPEQHVDLVVRLTEPRSKHRAVTHIQQVELQGFPEVLCAVSAWLQCRQRVQQSQNVRVLCRARLLGVVGGSRAQEGPGRTSLGLQVRWAACASSSLSLCAETATAVVEAIMVTTEELFFAGIGAVALGRCSFRQ